MDKHSESFTLDIGAPFPATLSSLAFENATRRNRPNLKLGDVVYARVSVAHPDLDPEVVCTDSTGRASGFGQLKEGLLSACSTGLSRRLLSRPPCAILAALGQQLQFEVAVGMNGRLWVHSPDPTTTVLITNALLNAELLSENQSLVLAQKLLQAL